MFPKANQTTNGINLAIDRNFGLWFDTSQIRFARGQVFVFHRRGIWLKPYLSKCQAIGQNQILPSSACRSRKPVIVN